MSLVLDHKIQRADVEAHFSGILRNWSQRWDADSGGFHSSVGGDGALRRRGDYRALLIQARLLYNFSEGLLHGYDEHVGLAKRTFRYLIDELRDESGWFTSKGRSPWQRPGETTVLGDPYTNLFVVIACAKYFKASHVEEAAQVGLDLFQLINEQCAADNIALHGIKAHCRPGGERSRDGRHDYSGNVMLHYLEALVQLADVDLGEETHQRLADVRSLFLDYIYDADHAICHDNFNGSFQEPRVEHGRSSQGHALEWIDFFRAIDAYALPEEVERNLLDTIAQRAIDPETHLFINTYFYDERKSAGGVDFWGQPEACKTYNLATHVYGGRYAEIGRHLLQAYFSRCVDSDQGVFYELDRNGVITSRHKGSSWKCDYHSLRMCVDLMDRQGGFLGE